MIVLLGNKKSTFDRAGSLPAELIIFKFLILSTLGRFPLVLFLHFTIAFKHIAINIYTQLDLYSLK